LRPDSNWTEIARGLTDANGECLFYNVPPGKYWVANIETSLYTQVWYGSDPDNTNHFDVHVERQVPLGMQPEGDMKFKMAFNWGQLTNCAFYKFQLYSRSTNTYPTLTLLEEVPDLVDTSYATTNLFLKGQTYFWSITGYDIWSYPVMTGSRDFTSQFTGDGGGVRRIHRVFGLARFSTRTVPGVAMLLRRKSDYQIAAQAISDDCGFYVFSDVSPGSYTLTHQDPNYTGGSLGWSVTVPAAYPYQGGYRLIKQSTVNLPDNKVKLATRTPTFTWAAISESVTYSFSLVRSSPYAVLHETKGLKDPTYTPAVVLPDGDSYFWFSRILRARRRQSTNHEQKGEQEVVSAHGLRRRLAEFCSPQREEPIRMRA
jgi:hypothetical protein